MKKWVAIFSFTNIFSLLSIQNLSDQWRICTKTAQRSREKPAQGLNSGFLYPAFAPFAIIGFVAYR
jgi:hypothetical protein